MRRRHIMALFKISLVVMVLALIVWYLRDGPRDITVDNVHISINDRRIHVTARYGEHHALEGTLGIGIPNSVPVTSCKDTTSGENCALWEGKAKLVVAPFPSGSDTASCHKVSWQVLSRDYLPTDCYNTRGSYWYGGSELYEQHWPINDVEVPMQQFVTNDYLMDVTEHKKVGPIAEPYWFNSRGAAILVPDEDIPLHVAFNQNQNGRFCLRADANGTQTPKTPNTGPILSYLICIGADVREVHKVMAEQFLPRPVGLPDEQMMKAPIWSSWARYKTGVSQKDIMKYADEIQTHGFPHSQIEIDDMYTTTYGDFEFDSIKFPDPERMIRELKERDIRVTSWVTPFANLNSKAFTEGMARDYWLKDAKGRTPGLVRWWQGTGAVLDFTNQNATDWFFNRLETLKQQTGIFSFKFDAGEVSHLPPYINSHLPLDNANQFTRHYAALVQRLGGATEMRAAYRTQSHSFYTRMMDKDSLWGYDNGLRTLIPTALVMSLTGYHYILADMIGGNGYGGPGFFLETQFPPKELFVRWVQLAACFPSMQFSFAPWQYDEEVIAIALAAVRWHHDRVAPAYIKAAQVMLKNGTPLLRPLWWLDPHDDAALASDSQFLVADEILVAPILEEGARMRDIYLPRGQWRDDLRDKVIQGKRWLRGYPVDLKDLPTFTYLGEP